MQQYSDLELGLHKVDVGKYSVEFRFSQPESDADIGLEQGRRILAEIDPFSKDLLKASLSTTSYGQILTKMLFGDPTLCTAFARARTSAQTQKVPLRLRLLIRPSAAELHNLRWETLRDPNDNTPLATDENIYFSRYLSSVDWSPVRLCPKGNLQALVAIANPTNLAEYDLANVSVEEELERARNGLGDIALYVLPDGKEPVTLDTILDRIRQEDLDIFYLICHGGAKKDEFFLYLENPRRKMQRVPVDEFVARFKELQRRPRLAILLSCKSAGQGTGDALTALGPRLAEIGVPAVLAMQDNISIETISMLIPIFFQELQKDGQIDRALTVARGRVRERFDHWVPALFMRLKSGRLWYTPGFSEPEGFRKFPAQINNIKNCRCTPILGPGLIEPIFGSLREISRHWAETFHYPMSPHDRESLPQVAQYLTVDQDLTFPFDKLKEYLQGHLRKTFAKRIPANELNNASELDDLIKVVGKQLRVENEQEPHRVLARLSLPLYITVNTDNLLESALIEAGKNPQTLLCPWNEYIEKSLTIFDRDLDYVPSPDKPLVFHLFGRWNEPDSVVLTEDDYFDFLIGTTRNKDLIPTKIREALSDTALLFLGFQMDEWNFRVLFRTILARPGGNRRSRFAHIAAQLEPDDERILEPQRARKYLADYFKGAAIDIYWGSPEEFLIELLRTWRNENAGR